MFKEWLKQFLAVCICAVIFLSPLSNIVQVEAANYVISDTQEDEENRYDAEYYMVEGKEVSKLFDFGLYDIGDILKWVFNFKTYTVIKHYEDNEEVEHYKCYFNTPNLQFLLRNNIAGKVTDGYTEDTYKVEDTEWVVSVGDNAEKVNAITKYGFDIPSYTYMGEYPKEVMSTAGILPEPKKWWQVLWRAITSIFGASFIHSPDAENFNTITYLNHTYTETSEFILDLFQKYYLDYFERRIPTDEDLEEKYFTGPYELLTAVVSENDYKAAKEFNDSNEDMYDKIKLVYRSYYEPYKRYKSITLDESHPDSFYTFSDLFADTQPHIGNQDAWHFMCSITQYNEAFKNWINSNTSTCYKMLKIIGEAEDEGNEHILPRYPSISNSGSANPDTSWVVSLYNDIFMRLEDPEDYKLTPTAFTESPEDHIQYNFTTSIAADINRYEEYVLKLRVKYRIQTREVTREVSGSGTQEDPYIPGPSTYGEWTTVQDDAEMDDTWSSAKFKYVDNSSYNETSGSYSGADDTSYTETKLDNFTVLYVYDGKESHRNNSDYMISYTAYYDYEKNMCLKSFEENGYDETYDVYTFCEDDFVSGPEQVIYHQYETNNAIILKYESFIDKFEVGDVDDFDDVEWIYYRQCMITNEGDDEECWSTKYGSDDDERTSLSILNVYVYSGIYTITNKYHNDTSIHELSTTEVYRILAALQTYCGAYYPEVIANMIKLMCGTYAHLHEGDEKGFLTKIVIDDDPRVMPYDVDSMIPTDKENYTIADPRVTLYKTHIIGSFISDLSINLGFGIYIKPQKSIISLAGKITELSVFMQQMCNFEFFDNQGLSPTGFWLDGYIRFVVAILVLFFLIKTTIALYKMGINGSNTRKILLGFFILIIEMAVAVLMIQDPVGLWKKIENIEMKIVNLGERVVSNSLTDTAYLYGDDPENSPEVFYYLPYLDTWAKYNTGYGMLAKQQLINEDLDEAELAKAYMDDTEKSVIPYIGKPSDDTQVKHWSIVLADAFNYAGRSTNVVNTEFIPNKHEDPDDPDDNFMLINSKTINNNAYRVVDHFLAPRIEIEDNYDNTITLRTLPNVNTNNEFQSGLVNMIVKLLNCALCCFLSLIKFMTFLWQWFMFYILIFKVALGKIIERKTTSIIMLETFSPTIAMVAIGLYAGVVMSIGMRAEGLLGIFIILFLFWCTFKLLAFWNNLHVKNATVFPNTLKWVYMLTNMKQHKANKAQDDLARQAQTLNRDIEDGSLKGLTSTLFEAITEGQDGAEGAIQYQEGVLNVQYKYLQTLGSVEEINSNMAYKNNAMLYANWYEQYTRLENSGKVNMRSYGGTDYTVCYRTLTNHCQILWKFIQEYMEGNGEEQVKHDCSTCRFSIDGKRDDAEDRKEESHCLRKPECSEKNNYDRWEQKKPNE